MKNLITALVAALLFAAVSACAQDGGTTFGIRAGVNFFNINGKDSDGDKLDNDLRTGYHVGVNAEIPIAPQFYFQPGLLFSNKGSRMHYDIGNILVTQNVSLSYVELPLNLLFRPALGNGHILLGFGPYLAYGVTGKIKTSSSSTEVVNGEHDVKFQSSVSASDPTNVAYVRGFDAGGNILFGYEFANKLSFQLNTQLGMVKINPDYEGVNDDSKWMNTGFGISAGYRF